jgi:hypothetical protein
MTTDQTRTFFGLKFHTGSIEISPKTRLLLLDQELQPLIEQHFKLSGGYLDEADELRNQESLQARSGIIESRFDLDSPGRSLMIQSDLDQSWTYVSLRGED